MNSLLDIFDRLSITLLETLKRFPLASLCAFLVSLILILLIEIDYSQTNEIALLANKVAFVLSLGIFLFPVLHLLNRSIFFKILGIGILCVYFYFLPLKIGALEVLRHILLLFALSFMFFWAPFLNTNISNKNIWEWTMKILLILLVTIVLTLTFYIVFYIFMFSLHELFGVEIANRRYLQFMILVLGIFSVNFFLSQMPKYICLLQLKKYTRVGEVFTKYILTPVTMLYILVLFAYIAKILIFGLWNEVTIDWMIIGFTFFAIATYMFWTPLVETLNSSFKKLIWGSLLILSVILALSIWLRFSQGISFETLYLILIFDIWLGLISLYFLFFNNASYKWLFFSISLLIAVSQSEYMMDFLLSLTI
ncbi:unknown [hydrothermal vent metagenome]|uniref:DUF4153 domain-containing protein n=1 Tax=hydrothermal vent metagenome TaxID=652676 RepID=A0A1W1CLA1_9ZZZZ